MTLNSHQVGCVAKAPSKIVILYSSIGYGHVSAARSIRQEIFRQEPQAVVTLHDIRAFMSPMRRRIDERLYWLVANYFPASFEHLFWSMQEQGNRAVSLADLPNDYPVERVFDFLRSEAPQAVLATHYGSAQVLGILRERGLLSDLKIGWLHTDFFEGYLPRISKRIDQTFLAHPDLAARWIAAGVPSDLVTTTGMPVNIPHVPPEVRHATLTALDLHPSVPTILLTGGKEGVGDYGGFVRSLAACSAGAVQVVALCGTNTRIRKTLVRQAQHLAPSVTVRSLGLVAQPEVIALMRSADLLVTKAGGLTPAEAFSIGLPTLLIDTVSGHERENAELFRRVGLAELSATADQAGATAVRLLFDQPCREAMLAAQEKFRNSSRIGEIARFALDRSQPPRGVPPDFGAERGVPATGVDIALAQLERDAPAELEILLSYSTAVVPERIVRENPFGHLAVRIGATVFSANHLADRQTRTSLLQRLDMSDYLFGVIPPGGRQQHVSTFGMAYGRDTIGLRVAGVPAVALAAMTAEAELIEAEFNDGAIDWTRSDFNCADAVARILGAGGYRFQSWEGWRSYNTMPLDVFDRALRFFEADRRFSIDLVAYRRLAGSQSSYRFSRFPLSLTQPMRSIARMLSDVPSDTLETAVKRQVTNYGDRRLIVEDLDGRPETSMKTSATETRASRLCLERALLVDFTRLLVAQSQLRLAEFRDLRDPIMRSRLGRLIAHSYDLAQIATERAEKIFVRSAAPRIRPTFNTLVNEYTAFDASRIDSRQVRIYLRRVRRFERTVVREFRLLRERQADVSHRFRYHLSEVSGRTKRTPQCQRPERTSGR